MLTIAHSISGKEGDCYHPRHVSIVEGSGDRGKSRLRG
jgi:hypothetical protein